MNRAEVTFYITLQSVSEAISAGCLPLLRKDITISSSRNSASANTHSQGCSEKGNGTTNNSLINPI